MSVLIYRRAVNVPSGLAEWIKDNGAAIVLTAVLTAPTTIVLDRRRHRHELERQRRDHEHELARQAEDHRNQVERAKLGAALQVAQQQRVWDRETGIDLGTEFRDFGPRLLACDPIVVGEMMLAFDKSLGRYVNNVPPALYQYLSEYSRYTMELINAWTRDRQGARDDDRQFQVMCGILLVWMPARGVVEAWCSTGQTPNDSQRDELWSFYASAMNSAQEPVRQIRPTEYDQDGTHPA